MLCDSAKEYLDRFVSLASTELAQKVDSSLVFDSEFARGQLEKSASSENRPPKESQSGNTMTQRPLESGSTLPVNSARGARTSSERSGKRKREEDGDGDLDEVDVESELTDYQKTECAVRCCVRLSAM